jgi:hypothetical protein
LLKCLRLLYCGVTLAFWDDLAIVASEHVKKGDRIFVSGRLVSDTVDESPQKWQVYYKVISLLIFCLDCWNLEGFYDRNGLLDTPHFLGCGSTVEFHRVHPASLII